MGSNGSTSRSIRKQDQEEEATPVGSRRHRAGFSDSFSSHGTQL